MLLMAYQVSILDQKTNRLLVNSFTTRGSSLLKSERGRTYT